MPDRMSILSPTGHLGFTPIERGSFALGVARRPDAIVADSGSCDIGPQPLGADEHCSPEERQRHDLPRPRRMPVTDLSAGRPIFGINCVERL
jgi:hypothetical protein